MEKAFQTIGVIGGLIILLAFQACGTSQPSQDESNPPQSTPTTTTTTQPFTWQVQGMRELITYSMRPQWSFDGEWIVFDRMYTSSTTGTTRWQVFRIKPDGTMPQCLTCDRLGNPGNNGGPHMSPNGRYVVFSAEKASHPALPPSCPTCADPGAGLYNDIAVIDLNTLVITRLNNVSAVAGSPGGSMHPRFSYDGTKIMWSDFQGATSELGNYQIAVANFDTSSGTPTINGLQYYNPGPKPEMMESQGFSPDGSKVFFTCTALAGQHDLNADICGLDLSTGTLTRVSETSGLAGEIDAYEEHGAINPIFNAFAFMGTGTYGVNLSDLNFLSWMKTDIWIRDYDSQMLRQMTFFNTPGHPHATGSRVVVSKMGWDPTGMKLVVSLWDYKNESNPNDDVPSLKIVEFSK